MSPYVRYAVRAALYGASAAASALIAGGDWKYVVGSGVIAAAGYAGVGAATPLEPAVGKQSVT